MTRWIVAGIALALVACGSVEDNPNIDAPGGDDDDAPNAVCTPWTATNFTPCTDDDLPANALAIDADATFDTELRVLTVGGVEVAVATKMLSQSGGPNLALLSVRNLSIAAGVRLRVTGTNGLIIAVHGKATIEGTIDVSAAAGQPGPGGSNAAACTGLIGTGGTISGNNIGAGGGGGGGYGEAGGIGGCALNCPAAGGGGGTIGGDLDLTPLRGGCSGGNGGGQGGGNAGSRGGGGGVVEISALESIDIVATGVVIAAGGGGGNGLENSGGGGGGGGAGGGILLEAITVGVQGSLCANGGAGGEGKSNTTGEQSGTGADGSCSEIFNAVAPKLGNGGNGGLGGAEDSRAGGLAGNGTAAGDSGGGGGGSVGVIRLSSSAIVPDAATVTPAPTFL